MPLIATRPGVYVATVNKVISDYYASLEETLEHLKCIKLKYLLGDNVAEFCASILVDAESLESDVNFKNAYFGYITHIFKNTYDPRFHLWATHKYK